MSVSRITLILDEQEMQALHKNAEENLRRPRDQVRFILRSVLVDHGIKIGETAGESLATNPAVSEGASA